MATELWWRNPDNYVRELVECGQGKVAWDRGYLVKKKIDPFKHGDLYFGQVPGLDWRFLTVGEQGTAEYAPGGSLDKPLAVYPTWTYGEDDPSLLLEVIEYPVGEDEDICSDTKVTGDERPVFGQKHMVVVTNLPALTTGPARSFIRQLKELQEEFPACQIYLHGLYSYRFAFGQGFFAADMEPRTLAQKGKIMLPAGKEVKFEEAKKEPTWVRVLGFSPKDLEVPRNRCMYNIKSASWASQNYDTLFNFKTSGRGGDPDATQPQALQTQSPLSSRAKPEPGDKMLCNSCTLQSQCKHYREGAVCTVPGAQPVRLANLFGSRDADQIIDGLGALAAAQANRVERGMAEEEALGDLNPDVAKDMNSLFKNGIALAKLINPALNGSGTTVNVGVAGAGAQVSVAAADPKQLVSAAMRELESRGIPRSEITTEMITAIVQRSTLPTEALPRPAAIQGKVIRHDEDVA